MPIDMRALLALSEGCDPREWGRLRAAQLDAGRQLAWFALAANLLATAVCAALLYPRMPFWQVASWSTLLIAGTVWVTIRRRLAPSRAAGHGGRTDIRATLWEGGSLALAWSVIPVFFCPQVPVATSIGLGLTLMIVMTGAAFAMAPLPLATLMFIGTLGFVSVVQLMLMHAVALAGGARLHAVADDRLPQPDARAGHDPQCAGGARRTRRDDQRAPARVRGERSRMAVGNRRDTTRDPAQRSLRAGVRSRAGMDIDGMPILQLLAGPSWDSGTFAAGLRALAEKLRNRDSFVNLRLPIRFTEQERWWQLAAAPRYDDRGIFCGFRGVGADVTDQRASADKINRMARFDTLTGLPNRRLITETLSDAMIAAEACGGRCAFMMLDLDRFKAVNDTLGHPVGDRLLCQVAERLGHMMSANESCGRLGGDEFALVVRDASDTGAVEELAGRIIIALSRPYDVDHYTLHIGASIGLAFGPRDGRTSEMLIRSADLALYRAKDAGRGVFRVYEPALYVQAEERRVLEIALRGALDRGEMSLAYQPIIDTQGGMLRGFEALLRWESPEFGTVPPSRFIPLAEDARIIAQIGAWVLRTACAEAASWPEGLRIAVNVSPVQLQNDGFVTTVATVLADSGLSADRLELEVTEGVFLREDRGATTTLARILDLGVRLSLDDFGIGHSSLGYLSRTRFSSIKIDGSFVRAAARGGREALAIIRAVVALAQSLDIATIAEGVETQDERQLVAALGCTHAQGVLFGRALPVTETRTLAERDWTDSAAA
ncbi:putative bifunctional diguanylate cyclase/phosphodiesterase [Sphingomonas aerolata]|uniref:putative bifunctional diguanylate cyclase/phosphodiesterase n=1 Tax=Sphingomonas aerolata TaxID=185951 RepID=UPI002FE2B266